MALHLGRAIGNGIRRTLNVTGLVLMVLMFVYTFGFVTATNTIVANALPGRLQSQAQIGFALPLSTASAATLGGVCMLIGMVVLLVAARAFVREPGNRGWDGSLFTRRMGWAILSAIAANILVSIAVSIGFVLLVIPGLYLAVSFMFVFFGIAVEDLGVLDAMRRSWALASGNRWRLLALVLIVGIGTGALSSVGSVVAIANPAAGQLVSLAITAPLAMFSYGILADAFLQVGGA